MILRGSEKYFKKAINTKQFSLSDVPELLNLIKAGEQRPFVRDAMGGVDSCGMSWMIFRLNSKTGGMCLAAAS